MILSRSNRYRLLVFLCLISTISFAEGPVEVIHIYDGDTVQLRDKRRVRLLGINAPEIRHKGQNDDHQRAELMGEEAKQYLKKNLLHRKVILEPDHEKSDHYHRTLAYVFLPDGTLLNEKMVEEGLAYCLSKSPNHRYEKRLLHAQQNAMNVGKGMWKVLLNRPGQSCIGNMKSKRFHTPGCSSGKRTHPKSKIFFSHIRDAFYHGYAPCKKCMESPLAGQ
jgi:micrococcal nuclease